jgi:hypothetical protein
MFHFTPVEFQMVKSDYRQMILGHDANNIEIRYRTPSAPTLTEVDPVYHRDGREYDPVEVVSLQKGVMKIVHERDLKLLAFGIVEVGDAIFYFLDTINLLEPTVGKPVILETLYFREPAGSDWTPNINQAGALKHHLAMTLKDQAIAEVVPAKRKL